MALLCFSQSQEPAHGCVTEGRVCEACDATRPVTRMNQATSLAVSSRSAAGTPGPADVAACRHRLRSIRKRRRRHLHAQTRWPNEPVTS